MDFRSLYKVLVYYKFLWSENFRQWNNGPFKKFFKSARFFKSTLFSKLKKYEITLLKIEALQTSTFQNKGRQI